jgi:hypothetical protein
MASNGGRWGSRRNYRIEKPRFVIVVGAATEEDGYISTTTHVNFLKKKGSVKQMVLVFAFADKNKIRSWRRKRLLTTFLLLFYYL